jgi:hypothetical protein
VTKPGTCTMLRGGARRLRPTRADAHRAARMRPKTCTQSSMGALCHNGRTRGRDAPPHINYEASGIDKQPTIQFSGVNLQVIDGSGSETTINGTGNLILGYDEAPGAQTGSHNLLLGGTGDSYTSYGGIAGGSYDKISGGNASLLPLDPRRDGQTGQR